MMWINRVETVVALVVLVLLFLVLFPPQTDRLLWRRGVSQDWVGSPLLQTEPEPAYDGEACPGGGRKAPFAVTAPYKSALGGWQHQHPLRMWKTDVGHIYSKITASCVKSWGIVLLKAEEII